MKAKFVRNRRVGETEHEVIFGITVSHHILIYYYYSPFVAGIIGNKNRIGGWHRYIVRFRLGGVQLTGLCSIVYLHH